MLRIITSFQFKASMLLVLQKSLIITNIYILIVIPIYKFCTKLANTKKFEKRQLSFKTSNR